MIFSPIKTATFSFSTINTVALRLLFGLASFLLTNQVFAVAVGDGCFDNQWITVKTDKSKRCPKATGWIEQQLFDIDDITSNRTLENYCVYKKLISVTPPPQPKVPPEIQYLIDKGYLEKNPQRDCVVVGSLAAPSTAPDVLGVLEKQLLIQSGKFELPPISLENAPVRMALLDTLPTDEHFPQANLTRSAHGASLAEIAQTLLCDPKTRGCYANLTSQLALSYIAEEQDGEYFTYRDDYKGGFFGSLTDLSLAIQKELQSWQEKSPDSRLVINLSLGWNGHSWGGHETNPAQYPAAVKSVYDSIVNAVCRGALVIAAAGNKSKNEINDYQAMLPARWEELPKPSSQMCYELTGTPIEKRISEEYQNKEADEKKFENNRPGFSLRYFWN